MSISNSVVFLAIIGVLEEAYWWKNKFIEWKIVFPPITKAVYKSGVVKETMRWYLKRIFWQFMWNGPLFSCRYCGVTHLIRELWYCSSAPSGYLFSTNHLGFAFRNLTNQRVHDSNSSLNILLTSIHLITLSTNFIERHNTSQLNLTRIFIIPPSAYFSDPHFWPGRHMGSYFILNCIHILLIRCWRYYISRGFSFSYFNCVFITYLWSFRYLIHGMRSKMSSPPFYKHEKPTTFHFLHLFLSFMIKEKREQGVSHQNTLCIYVMLYKCVSALLNSRKGKEHILFPYTFGRKAVLCTIQMRTHSQPSFFTSANPIKDQRSAYLEPKPFFAFYHHSMAVITYTKRTTFTEHLNRITWSNYSPAIIGCACSLPFGCVPTYLYISHFVSHKLNALY